MNDEVVILLRRSKETDVLGQPTFSITGIRKPTWLDSLLFAVETRRHGEVTELKPEIFNVDIPGNRKIPCELAVYPGKKVQDVVWKSEIDKQLDYSR